MTECGIFQRTSIRFLTPLVIACRRFGAILFASRIFIENVLGKAMIKRRIFLRARVRFFTAFVIARRRFRAILFTNCIVIKNILGKAMTERRIFLRARVRFFTALVIARRCFRAILFTSCIVIKNVLAKLMLEHGYVAIHVGFPAGAFIGCVPLLRASGRGNRGLIIVSMQNLLTGRHSAHKRATRHQGKQRC